MTADNLLDELEALVAAATAGEWTRHTKPWIGSWVVDERQTEVAASYSSADAACIVALKNAAPELLRRAREKDKMVAAYDEALWLARCQRDQASGCGS